MAVVEPILAEPLGAASRHSVLRRLIRDPWAVVCAVIIAAYLLVAIFAPLIVHVLGQSAYLYHSNLLDDAGVPNGAFGGVSARHWFGVEPTTGRDLFSIVVLGARTSIFVGVAATFFSILLGAIIGVSAGFFGGWIDKALSRFTDLILCFPFLIFTIAFASIAPASWPRPLLLVFVIGAFGWASIARVVRGQTFTVKTQEFVESARVFGAPQQHIVVHHILPNISSTIIVFSTISIPGAIGAEAALSFLGVGVTPPTPSWGRTIGSAVQWIGADPWYLVAPGAALVLITLTFNILGDSLQEALDPQQSDTVGK